MALACQRRTVPQEKLWAFGKPCVFFRLALPRGLCGAWSEEPASGCVVQSGASRSLSGLGDLGLRVSQYRGSWHWSCCPCRNWAKGGGRAIGIPMAPQKGVLACPLCFSPSFALLSQSEQQKQQQEAEKLHRQERKAVRRSAGHLRSRPRRGRPFH